MTDDKHIRPERFTDTEETFFESFTLEDLDDEEQEEDDK